MDNLVPSSQFSKGDYSRTQELIAIFMAMIDKFRIEHKHVLVESPQSEPDFSFEDTLSIQSLERKDFDSAHQLKDENLNEAPFKMLTSLLNSNQFVHQPIKDNANEQNRRSTYNIDTFDDDQPSQREGLRDDVELSTEVTSKSLTKSGGRSSRYRGVTRHKYNLRYETHLWDNTTRREGENRKGTQLYLGGYDIEEDAARAYDLAALKYWGSTTKTNFQITNYEEELKQMQKMSREEVIVELRRNSSGFLRGFSKYRGVTRHSKTGKWQARIADILNPKKSYLGTFDTEEEAAEAYDKKAIEKKGLNAVTNFDKSRYRGDSTLPNKGGKRAASTDIDQTPRLKRRTTKNYQIVQTQSQFGTELNVNNYWQLGSSTSSGSYQPSLFNTNVIGSSVLPSLDRRGTSAFEIEASNNQVEQNWLYNEGTFNSDDEVRYPDPTFAYNCIPNNFQPSPLQNNIINNFEVPFMEESNSSIYKDEYSMPLSTSVGNQSGGGSYESVEPLQNERHSYYGRGCYMSMEDDELVKAIHGFIKAKSKD